MFVEHTSGNQVALHLPKFFPDLSALGRVFPTFFQPDLGELPMTKVRGQDPRSSVLGPRPSACSSVQSAAAILLVGRTFTRGPPTGLCAASLTWPFSSEPPFDFDSHIIFCKHLNTPTMEYCYTATWVVVRGNEFLDFRSVQK